MDFTPDPGFVDRYAHSHHVHDVIGEVINQIDDAFRAIAPRDTGRMVNSAIGTTERTRQGWTGTYEVPVETTDGRKTKYAKFVEFGTENMRAQNNLRHSLEIVEALNK